MISFPMKDTKDNHPVAFNAVKEFVREAAKKQPAKAAVVDRPTFRVLRKLVNGMADFIQQLIAESRTLLVIPRLRIVQIRLGFRTDGDEPFH